MHVDEVIQRATAAWSRDPLDHQVEPIVAEQDVDSASRRVCFYYRTGAGKTIAALMFMLASDVDNFTVVAPPATHEQWRQQAQALGLTIETISHALYRQADRKFSRLRPFVIDEFHLLGGAGGKGWKKLAKHARGMQAPLVILSATPNYNDVERVYCVSAVLSTTPPPPYLTWLFANCELEPNPFAATPKVLGFSDGRKASEHLAELPHVYYVEDPYDDFPITDIQLNTQVHPWLERYGFDERTMRICASIMEQKSAYRRHHLLTDDELYLRTEVYDELVKIAGDVVGPLLVFCARATVAKAAHRTALRHNARSTLVVHDDRKGYNRGEIHLFKAGHYDVMFGTATMATGVDGLDKICHTLVLLDDTDDGSLRKQIMGRILPRGVDVDVSRKIVVRLLRPS